MNKIKFLRYLWLIVLVYILLFLLVLTLASFISLFKPFPSLFFNIIIIIGAGYYLYKIFLDIKRIYLMKNKEFGKYYNDLVKKNKSRLIITSVLFIAFLIIRKSILILKFNTIIFYLIFIPFILADFLVFPISKKFAFEIFFEPVPWLFELFYIFIIADILYKIYNYIKRLLTKNFLIS